MTHLEELIERYGTLKNEMDGYKKQVDADNKAIKTIMESENLSECSYGGYTAKYSVSVSESFDEEKLIAKLRSMTYKDDSCTGPVSVESLGIIKMQPYVDMEVLENAIYKGLLNAADLADCKVRKETPRLTISKAKKKVEE